MNNIEFAKEIPAAQLADIFKSYFEQHMIAYGILRDVEFVSLNDISMDKASITYSVKLLDAENKERLLNTLQSNSANIIMYGKSYTPNVFLNGDLLCITINK